MKRDLELCRELLIAAEAIKPNQGVTDLEIHIEGYSQEQITYHLQMLMDAKMIEGQGIATLSEPRGNFMIQRLMWAGHEFLDASRAEGVWQKVRTAVVEQGKAWTVSAIGDYMKQLVLENLIGS